MHPLKGREYSTRGDLAAPYGEPVYSAGNGRVILPSGYRPGLRAGSSASAIKVDTTTLYAHMSRILVRKGETVPYRTAHRKGRKHGDVHRQPPAFRTAKKRPAAGPGGMVRRAVLISYCLSIIRRVMNIEEAKRIPLEDYLRRMGFSPVKEQGDSLWYRSPFRQERTPSFKVSLSRNL